MSTITEKEWRDKGNELFGGEQTNWRFQCPACGNVASIEMAKEKWPEVKGKGWNPSSECIGRYTDKVKCDWAAYGLFAGPLFVKENGGEKSIPLFDFEGKVFTDKKKNP